MKNDDFESNSSVQPQSKAQEVIILTKLHLMEINLISFHFNIHTGKVVLMDLTEMGNMFKDLLIHFLDKLMIEQFHSHHTFSCNE